MIATICGGNVNISGERDDAFIRINDRPDDETLRRMASALEGDRGIASAVPDFEKKGIHVRFVPEVSE